MAQRMAADMREQGMKAEDIKLTPDMFRAAAPKSASRSGLILSEVVRDEGPRARSRSR